MRGKYSKRLIVDSSPMLDTRLSGIGHTALSLSRALNDQAQRVGYEVRFLVPFRKRERMLELGFPAEKLLTVYLPSRIWNNWPRVKFSLPIDLFYGRGTYLFTNYKKWPLLFSKSMLFVYDASIKIHPEYVERKNLTMLRKNLGRWMNGATRILTISESSKAELVRYMDAPESKIDIVYCGVDQSVMHRESAGEVNRVLRRYGISSPYLMFLSNIEPRKNIQNLITALTSLEQYKGKLGLLIVGGMSWASDDIERAIEAAQKDGWIIYRPTVYVPDADLPALISGSVALVHPAFHEGFGVAPLQAISCETRAIVADIPVMREILGDAAGYFNPQSPADIARSIESVLNTPINNEVRKHLKARAALFNWNDSADKIVHIAEKLNIK